MRLFAARASSRTAGVCVRVCVCVCVYACVCMHVRVQSCVGASRFVPLLHRFDGELEVCEAVLCAPLALSGTDLCTIPLSGIGPSGTG